jgi:hypothetical protein
MQTTTEITATFTKLRSGDWGLRVVRDSGYMPKAGEYVRVVKKSGEASVKPVGRVIWNDDQIALCTIAA